MAALRERDNYRQKNNMSGERRLTNTYIDGNVVRTVETMPGRPDRNRRKATSSYARRNREKALRMDMPYVVFLTAASVATVFVCVNFLKLQAQGITYRQEVAALESQLSNMKLNNDNAYEEAISSVSMEQIKEIAVNDLGMVYAEEGQVITYNSQEGDYIRQYMDIPVE